jgi:hypothetical protein
LNLHSSVKSGPMSVQSLTIMYVTETPTKTCSFGIWTGSSPFYVAVIFPIETNWWMVTGCWTEFSDGAKETRGRKDATG